MHSLTERASTGAQSLRMDNDPACGIAAEVKQTDEIALPSKCGENAVHIYFFGECRFLPPACNADGSTQNYVP